MTEPTKCPSIALLNSPPYSLTYTFSDEPLSMNLEALYPHTTGIVKFYKYFKKSCNWQD